MQYFEQLSGEIKDWSPEKEQENLDSAIKQAEYHVALEGRIKNRFISLAAPVSDLGFQPPIEKLLLGAKIRTISDLIKNTSFDLLEIPGLGKSRLESIVYQLSVHYLRLAETPPATEDTAAEKASEKDLDATGSAENSAGANNPAQTIGAKAAAMRVLDLSEVVAAASAMTMGLSRLVGAHGVEFDETGTKVVTEERALLAASEALAARSEVLAEAGADLAAKVNDEVAMAAEAVVEARDIAEVGVSEVAEGAAAALAEAAEPAEEKTGFDVLDKDLGFQKKSEVIKAIRQLTSLGLKEVKEVDETKLWQESMWSKSFDISITLENPSPESVGLIHSAGGLLESYALFVADQHLHYVYSRKGKEVFRISSEDALPIGTFRLVVEFTRKEGGPEGLLNGTLAMYINDQIVATREIHIQLITSSVVRELNNLDLPNRLALMLSRADESGYTFSEGYEGQTLFTGKVLNVRVSADEEQTNNH